MPVAGDAKVLQVTEIHAKLERMIIADPRPIIDKLKLLHFLNERAVAVVVKRVSKLKTALAVGCKSGHALSRRIVRNI